MFIGGPAVQPAPRLFRLSRTVVLTALNCPSGTPPSIISVCGPVGPLGIRTALPQPRPVGSGGRSVHVQVLVSSRAVSASGPVIRTLPVGSTNMWG